MKEFCPKCRTAYEISHQYCRRCGWRLAPRPHAEATIREPFNRTITEGRRSLTSVDNASAEARFEICSLRLDEELLGIQKQLKLHLARPLGMQSSLELLSITAILLG